MRNAQKPDHASLNILLTRLKEGRYVIPDFQREFEWQARDIRDLIASIFRDYYIGSLLLWKGTPENFEALSCEPVYGHAGTQGREYIVLDGQQRLTAIYYAFVAPSQPLPRRSSRAFFYVRVDRFMLEDGEDAFDYQWEGRSWSLIAGSPEEQYRRHIFPMSIIGEGGWALPTWAQGYTKYWRDEHARATDAGDDLAIGEAARIIDMTSEFGRHLQEITEQYQISYVELDRALEIDRICDIFTQINSRGVRLDVFDLLNALLKKKDVHLKAMWRETQEKLDVTAAEKMNVYVLQVMSILHQTYCSPKYLYLMLPGVTKPARRGDHRAEVLVPDGAAFIQDWNRAVTALRRALDLLKHPQEYGVSKWTYLPYKTILPVFAALQVRIGALPPEEQLTAQRKFRQWYWASVFTNQYSASSESTSARDFGAVLDWIGDDAIVPAAILDFRHGFRNLPLEGETKQGTSRYNGVFNLFILNGARDWMSGKVPPVEDVQDHHIIPRSWGASRVGDRINSILNRCPLTAETNRDAIGDRLPNRYLPELIAHNGEAEVRAMLETHLITPAALAILLRDSFGPEDFESFIAERKQSILHAIEARLIAERIEVPPQFKLVDEEIEKAELDLRALISARLANDAQMVPHPIREKVEGRLASAAKSPTFDADTYRALVRWLEYADLRELQAIITNAALWSRFTPPFAGKPELDVKFGQLAGLRNAIRHSRHVDPVVEMEGRAAIHWFRHLLAT